MAGQGASEGEHLVRVADGAEDAVDLPTQATGGHDESGRHKKGRRVDPPGEIEDGVHLQSLRAGLKPCSYILRRSLVRGNVMAVTIRGNSRNDRSRGESERGGEIPFDCAQDRQAQDGHARGGTESGRPFDRLRVSGLRMSGYFPASGEPVEP